MKILTWRAEYELGIADVDFEHRQLVNLINDCFSEMQAGNKETVMNMLGELYSKVAAHFALEEKQMRAHHYDAYAEHKSEHEQLLDEVLDIMDDFEYSNKVNFAEFSEKLDRWFTGHFKNQDARLHKMLGDHH